MSFRFKFGSMAAPLVAVAARADRADSVCRPRSATGKPCGTRGGRRSDGRRTKRRRAESAGGRPGSRDLDRRRLRPAVPRAQDIRLAANYGGAWTSARRKIADNIAAAEALQRGSEATAGRARGQAGRRGGRGSRALLEEARRDADVTPEADRGRRPARPPRTNSIARFAKSTGPAMRPCRTSPSRAPMWRSTWPARCREARNLGRATEADRPRRDRQTQCGNS